MMMRLERCCRRDTLEPRRSVHMRLMRLMRCQFLRQMWLHIRQPGSRLLSHLLPPLVRRTHQAPRRVPFQPTRLRIRSCARGTVLRRRMRCLMRHIARRWKRRHVHSTSPTPQCGHRRTQQRAHLLVEERIVIVTVPERKMTTLRQRLLRTHRAL